MWAAEAWAAKWTKTGGKTGTLVYTPKQLLPEEDSPSETTGDKVGDEW